MSLLDFYFFQCWKVINTSQLPLSNCFSSIKAKSNLMEQVVA